MKEITVVVVCNKCGAKPKDTTRSDHVAGWFTDLQISAGGNTVLVDLCPVCGQELFELIDTGERVRNMRKPARKPKKDGYPYPGMKTAPVNTWKCACGNTFKTERGLNVHIKRNDTMDDVHEAAS